MGAVRPLRNPRPPGSLDSPVVAQVDLQTGGPPWPLSQGSNASLVVGHGGYNVPKTPRTLSPDLQFCADTRAAAPAAPFWHRAPAPT